MWGHQIRSYVLQPYTLVKDLRTGVETPDIFSVLDGDLDQFLKPALTRHYDHRKNRAYGSWVVAEMD